MEIIFHFTLVHGLCFQFLSSELVLAGDLIIKEVVSIHMCYHTFDAFGNGWDTGASLEFYGETFLSFIFWLIWMFHKYKKINTALRTTVLKKLPDVHVTYNINGCVHDGTLSAILSEARDNFYDKELAIPSAKGFKDRS